jgi:predicted CXXCH cytochrome family protein
MRRAAPALAAFMAAAGWGGVCLAAGPTPYDMINTKHNLSMSGTGTIRAVSEDRICVFCHTPHNSAPLSPLWNKTLQPQVYVVYASPTLKAGPLPQPSGPTKLCLTCHDGTIAMGAVLNPAGGIGMLGSGFPPLGSLSQFGLDLSTHHPVSFPYHTALPNDQLAPSPPFDLVFGGSDEVHCTTCHDPHNDLYGKFLLKDNRFSSLCITCHQMPNWAGSAHAVSTSSVVGILPRPPKTWPTYTQLNEWGCETCHTPHFAPTPQGLLNFTSNPPDPYSCTTGGCHASDPGLPPHLATSSSPPDPRVAGGKHLTGGRADIAGQLRKLSGHHQGPSVFSAAPRRGAGMAGTGISNVDCTDCHNPHVASDVKAEAPYVSGRLLGVSGVDRNGAEIPAARYEYEICFKCHADYNRDLVTIPRVLTVTNARQSFDTSNASYHPVLGMGRNLDVPSIPSSLEPTLSASQVIYCTSCHADDAGGSRGPHGSSFPAILKERYETGDFTPESYDNYALCYRCHDRSTILRDTSFMKKTIRTTPTGGGHSGHLSSGAPCSACHDPHGVSETGVAPGGTGSHTHLINFDTRFVMPLPGATYPVFHDAGASSGTCALVCHGVVHNSFSYP